MSLEPNRFLCISFTISEVGARGGRGENEGVPVGRVERRRAVVIGSGPNGLAAGIELARAGMEVTVHEASAQLGGGARSAELTLPGFVHDICSAVYPMALSPCFERYPLHHYGLEWIHPDAPMAHPLDDGTAVVLERSLDGTCANLGADGERWARLVEPFVSSWPKMRDDVLGPQPRWPREPLRMAGFGIKAMRSASALAESAFRTERARALFAGIAAHSILPLEAWGSAAIGLVLAILAHYSGWPIPRGGAQRISNALGSYFTSLCGQIRRESRIETLPDAGVVMCDITPRQLLALGGDRFPASFRRALQRWRYGPGVFKLDWALDGPVPWRAPECRRAGTVHLGGTLDEIARWESQFTGAPFVLLAQPSLFDGSRAPQGKHTAWAYCHVPKGTNTDMTDAIEAQVERFAPGFRSLILARHALTPKALEHSNANLVGGDIAGGSMTLDQLFVRPTWRLYGTPVAGVYLCSSSTPPGAGVHGMCGYHAVERARRDGRVGR
ncbi:MAG: NAD(P)/FAD-dependent oxidoreductase [Acidobacteriia bacterium]|nr:NAD(P)/FAD-dependent oxidoreductase [Terriglobia bacterium]